MADSSQKFIARNRAPRVQIEYDVELYGAEKKVQLPFVMGVMSDLSGKSLNKPPSLDQREFLEIDVDNFDKRMKGLAPRVEFSVPNTLTGEGSMPVDITFESMDDFSPAAIAKKVEPLRKLLEARTQLENLTTYMDGKSGAEELIGKLIADPTTLRALTGVAAADGVDTAAALDALRGAAVEQDTTGDTTGAALAGLRDAAQPEQDAGDTTGAALAGLAAATVETAAPEDNTADALAALGQSAAAEDAETDTTADALAALGAQPVEHLPEADTTSDALASLGKQAVEVASDVDTTDDALTGLAASAPAATPPKDTTGQALDALAQAAPVDTPNDDSTVDAALGALADAVVDDASAEADVSSAALDALASTVIDAPEDAEDTTDQALDALANTAPVDTPAGEGALDAALGSLAEAAVDADTPDEDIAGAALDALAASDQTPDVTDTALDDALTSLSDAAQPAEEAADTTEDALAALAETPVVTEDQVDTSAAALDALRDVPAVPDGAPDTTLEDALGSLAELPSEATQPDTGVDDALSALADLPAETAEVADAATDALDALRDLPTETDTPAEDGMDDALSALADLPTEQPDEPDKAGAALEALRDVQTQASDTAADNVDAALAELSATPVEALDTEPDAADAALAALTESAVAEVPVDDATDDILAELADATPAEDLEADERAEALDALRNVPGTSEATTDQTDDILADLSLATEPVTPAADETSDVLAGLADLDLPEAPAEDTTAQALEAVRDAVPAPEPEADPLAGLDDLLDAGAAEAAPADDPLAGLDDLLSDTTPSEPAAPADDPLAGLDDLLGDTQPAVSDSADDDPLAGLDDLLGDAAPAEQAQVPEADPLAGLDDLLADDASPSPTDAADDPLAGLDDLLAADPAPAETMADDPLAGLDDLLGDSGPTEVPPQAQPEDDPLAGLDALLAESPEPAEATPALADDDPLAGLDDLLADTSEPQAEVETDPLAGLDDLLADAPESPSEDDPLAGLDDILAGTSATSDEQPETESAMDQPSAPVQVPFGVMSAERPDAEALPRDKFRIAILGDFSGRSASGRLEVGAGLAARRAIPFDIDDVEELIESFATKLVLPLGKDGKGIEVPLGELDDLHPDELYDNVDIFAELAGMRQRLQAGSMADAAVEKLKEWGAQFGADDLTIRTPSPATSVPADKKLSDFSSLIGDVEGRLATPAPGADFIAQIVGPYVLAAPDPGAAGMLEAVDEALSAAMRLILHAPEFQAIEAQWRSLDFLARRVETNEKLELVLYDVSAEEIAADLAAQEDLAEAGITRMLLDLPAEEEGPGAFSAVMGLYTFEETPPHAELLARLARLGAHMDAPIFAAMSPEFMKTPRAQRHPLVAQAWDDLRAMPEAKYLGLVTPRFMLRRPYGAKSEPISPFKFEEFTKKAGLKSMLWANPVVAVTVLLAASYTKNGKALGLGEIMSLGDIPFHFVNDAHGDQVALPCTERNITTTTMEDIVTRGFMPIVSPRGRDEIRLASFQSVGGGEIMGPWSGVERPAPSKAPAPPTLTADVATEAAVEDDLDALLADLGGGDDTDSGDIDADLAALLEGL